MLFAMFAPCDTICQLLNQSLTHPRPRQFFKFSFLFSIYFLLIFSLSCFFLFTNLSLSLSFYQIFPSYLIQTGTPPFPKFRHHHPTNSGPQRISTSARPAKKSPLDLCFRSGSAKKWTPRSGSAKNGLLDTDPQKMDS